MLAWKSSLIETTHLTLENSCGQKNGRHDCGEHAGDGAEAEEGLLLESGVCYLLVALRSRIYRYIYIWVWRYTWIIGGVVHRPPFDSSKQWHGYCITQLPRGNSVAPSTRISHAEKPPPDEGTRDLSWLPSLLLLTAVTRETTV